MPLVENTTSPRPTSLLNFVDGTTGGPANLEQISTGLCQTRGPETPRRWTQAPRAKSSLRPRQTGLGGGAVRDAQPRRAPSLVEGAAPSGARYARSPPGKIVLPQPPACVMRRRDAPASTTDTTRRRCARGAHTGISLTGRTHREHCSAARRQAGTRALICGALTPTAPPPRSSRPCRAANRALCAACACSRRPPGRSRAATWPRP